MSNYEQNFRLRFKAETAELTPAVDALERIEALLKEQGKTAQQATQLISEAAQQQRVVAQQQAADIRMAAQQQVADQRAALQQQTNALKAEADQQTAIVKAEQSRQTAQVKAELAQQTATVRAELAQQNSTFQSHTSGLESAYKSVRNYMLAAFGIQEAIEFGKAVIDAKGKVDVFQGGLTQMLGSKREADALMAELARMAVTTPFKVEDLMDTTGRLKAMGVATNELIPTVRMLGDIAAIAGTEKLPLVAKAYTDIMSKGKLMKQETNQMVENNVPLYDLLAVSMGKTRDAVVQMAEDHEISFAHVKKALQDATSEGGRYYRMMEIQSETVAGQVSNLADKFFFAKARIGDYVENGLQKGINGTADLIDVLAGSQSAIDRTVSWIRTAVIAWTGYEVIVNRAKVAEAAATATRLTSTVVGGTYNLVLISMAGTTDGFTAAQVRSAVAARSLWATIAANPIGALLTAVTAITVAYSAWDAMNTQVTYGMGEQEAKLRSEQALLNTHVQTAMQAKQGTMDRAMAIQYLVNKYPEYFSGLNGERTSNAQLNQILTQVNRSYQSRIALAAEAYRVEANTDRLKDLFKKEQEIMQLAEQRLPKELLIEINGDPAKLIKALDASSAYTSAMNGGIRTQFKDLWNGMGWGAVDALRSVEKSIGEIETQSLEAVKKRDVLRQQESKSMLDAEMARHEMALKAAKGSQAELRAEEKRHQDNLTKLQDDGATERLVNQEKAGNKQKEINALTAKEIAALLKQQIQETYQERKAALDALEKQEIEAANRRVVSKKASDGELKAAAEAASKEILAIHDKYEKLRLAAFEQQKIVIQDNLLDQVEAAGAITQAEYEALDEKKKIEKQKRDEAKKTAKEAQKDDEETTKMIIENLRETYKAQQETIEAAKKSRVEALGMAFDFLSQQGGIIGGLAHIGQQVSANYDLLSGKARETANENLRVAQQVYDTTKSQYDQFGVGTLAGITTAATNLETAKQGALKTGAETAKSWLGMAGVAYEVLSAIADAWNAAEKAKWQATAQAAANTRKILEDFSAFQRALYKEDLDTQLKAAQGNYTAQVALLEAYYKRERELVTAQIRVDDVLAFTQKIAEIRASDMEEGDKMLETMASVDKYRREQGLREKMAAIEVEKAARRAFLDLQLQQIEDAYQSQKKALEQELADFNDAADKKKERATQESEDRQLRLTADDIFRQQLLDSGEAREVKALEAAKQRELEKAKTAEEKARIIEAFDKLIAEKHAEYEDAKLDKTKAVKLATEEAKAQEKDKINALEEEKAAKALDVANRIKTNEIESAHQKELANRAYTNSVRGMNEELFNANKALQIVELQVEVAKLRARGGNAGLVNELNGLINRLGGTVYDNSGGKIFPAWKFDNASGSYVSPNQEDFNYVSSNTDGNGTTRGFVNAQGQDVEIFYNASRTNEDQLLTVYQKRADGKPGVMFKLRYADGYVPATGQRFAEGTEYLDGPYPTGTDTIPIWANRGERILPTESNARLGGITNDELVQRATQFTTLRAELDLLRQNPPQWGMIRDAGLSLPGGVTVNTPGMSIDGLADEMRRTREAIEAKKLVSVRIDQNGFALSEQGQQSVVHHYGNLMTR